MCTQILLDKAFAETFRWYSSTLCLLCLVLKNWYNRKKKSRNWIPEPTLISPKEACRAQAEKVKLEYYIAILCLIYKCAYKSFVSISEDF